MSLLTSEKRKWFYLAALLLFMFVGYTQSSILGLALTLVLFAFACTSPKQAILLLFVYIPIRVFIIEYNSGLRFVSDALIFGALLNVVWISRKSIRTLFRFQLFEYAFFAFLLIGAVSAFITGVEPVAIIQQLRSFLLFYFVFYILYRIGITRSDIINVVWIFVWTAILIIIQALFEKLSVRSLFLPESWEAMPLSAKNRVRIYGMLGNPNVLGIYLMFAFIAFYWAKHKLDEFNGRYLDILNLFVIGLLVLTYSRGTWIGFFIAAVVFVLLTKKWRAAFDFVKYLAISLLIIVLPLNLLTNFIESSDSGKEKVSNIQQFDAEGESGFVDRIGSTFSDETVTGSESSGRLYIVKKGFEVFTDHPIIGTGLGTYGDSATLSHSSPIYRNYGITRNFYSDNQYIQIIVQTGVVGVLAFAVFLLSLLWKFLRTKRRETNLNATVAGVLLGGYFMGLVYNLWESDIFTLSFFALLAAASLRAEKESLTGILGNRGDQS